MNGKHSPNNHLFLHYICVTVKVEFGLQFAARFRRDRRVKVKKGAYSEKQRTFRMYTSNIHALVVVEESGSWYCEGHKRE